MTCRKITPLLDAFTDGELSAEKMLETKQHLLDCRTCTERVALSRATRDSLKRAVRLATPVSIAFRERVTKALAAERLRELNRQKHERAPLSWRNILPVAAAAAVTLVWAATANRPQMANAGHTNSNYAAASNSSVEQAIDQLIDNYMRRERPQVTEAKLLPELEPEVGLPLKVPTRLLDYGARFQGGSVVPVNDSRFASLEYKMGEHRVKLYVYNPTRVPLERRLTYREINRDPVYVGTYRGVSLAAAEKRGVGYAIASDMSDDESAELIATVYH